MQTSGLYTTFKILSFVILLVMIGAIGYSVAISITHWSGIGV